MKKIIFMLLIVFFLLGSGLGILTNYYSLNYLYQTYIRRDFVVNPRAEINPEKKYPLEIWYYPYFECLPGIEYTDEDLWQEIADRVQNEYPNIELKLKELNFSDGEDELWESLQNGNPPDLYMNPGPDQLWSKELQIPLTGYLTEREREMFARQGLVLAEEEIWSWPYLFYEQKWLGKNLPETFISPADESNKLISRMEKLPSGSLAFNYDNQLVLRQLMSQTGQQYFSSPEGPQYTAVREDFLDVLEMLHHWRKEGIFVEGTINMNQRYLELLLTGQNESSVLVGPFNLPLENLLRDRTDRELTPLEVNNLYSAHSLSVFRQRDYLGDDHSRAAVEAGSLICQQLAKVTARDLDVLPGYTGSLPREEINLLLQVTPETEQFWREELVSSWGDFWEQGLTPEQIAEKF